ncbi:hypothetical protein FEO87_04230 [Stenotrophomonas maltophilia]|nr:hypothetical protein FEO87_04230 [Stenotrophomonas maltophilia]
MVHLCFAWIKSNRNRISRQLIEEHPRMAWIYVSTKIDTHQQRGSPPANSRGKLSEAGRGQMAGA